jgi:hypothetical protein
MRTIHMAVTLTVLMAAGSVAQDGVAGPPNQAEPSTRGRGGPGDGTVVLEKAPTDRGARKGAD